MRKITLTSRFIICLLLLTNITVFAQTVSFNSNQSQGCAPFGVVFTNTTTDANAYRYEWTFGDGTTLTDTMPTTVSHTYSTSGNYSPYFVVYNINGVQINYTYSTNGNINVDGPTLNIPDTVCPNDMINFCINGQFNSVSFDFGDGSTGNQECQQHAYSSIGPKTVIATVVTSSCGTVTLTKTIIVGGSSIVPNPHINVSSTSTCPGASVNFGTGGYAFYHWTFGDNATDSVQNTYHTYTSIGQRMVHLAVKNGCNNYGFDSVLISVGNNPMPFPTGSWFTLNPSQTVACPNSTINFNAPGGYTKYVWNYGDGSPSDSTTDNNRNHHYGTDTTVHNVSVKIITACGNDTVLYTQVGISTHAPFTNQNGFYFGNSSPVCPNSSVNLYAAYGFTSYQWNFGDGSPLVTTTQEYTNHHYGTGANQFPVSVRVTNNCGRDTVLYGMVTISNNAPWPNNSYFQLSGGPNPSCPNSTVHLEAPQGYLNYKWNFGDSSAVVTTTSYYFNHIYGNDTGSFTASVVITNSCNHDTTLYRTIYIENGVGFPQNQQNFSLGHSMDPICANDYVGFNAPGGYPTYEWHFGDNSPVVITSNSNTNHKYTGTSSVYYVGLKITNACGNDTILYDSVHVGSNAGFPNYPDFRIRTNQTVACPNSNMGFEAPGGFSHYSWNFGDDTTHVNTTNNNYSHLYGDSLRNYTVSVKITNGCNQDTTLNLSIQIMNNVGFPNDPNFATQTNPNPACVLDPIGFQAPDGYSSYKWIFGDGDSTMSSQKYVNHAYDSVKTYFYSVKITNACGRDTTLYGTTQVGNTGSFGNNMSIESTGSSACPNDLVNFKLNGGSFSHYYWNFGDGNMATTNGENIQHAFGSTGIYNVYCKVVNGCGDTATVYASVQINNNSPISPDLTIESSPNPSCPNDQVFFLIKNGQSTTQYIWNFGDGTAIDTTIGSGPGHVYTTAGTYTVTVVAKNSCGNTKTITLIQTVGGGTPPMLVGNDGKKMWGFPGGDGGNTSAGCAGDAIVFYFFGDVTNNVWDFGDGNSGTATEHMLVYGGDGAMPVTIIKHVFTTTGSKMIHLTLTNGCNLSSTDSMMINIGGGQEVNGDMTTSAGPFTTCAPVSFLGFGGSSYAWDFGDGTTLNSSSPTVSHTYANQNIYVASVVITNGCGNTATYSKVVNVTGVGGPAITVTTNHTPTCAGGNNGTVSVLANGGVMPYTYMWSDANHQTTQTASGLASGSYSVTVTDNNGCPSVLAITVANATSIALNQTSTPSACSASTGVATVSVTSGGNAPFTYAWSTGATTSAISNVSHGSYNVVVTDSNGCVASTVVNVSDANAPAIALNAVTNATCHGGSTGAVNINVTGGGSNYTYLWSNGATTQDISGVMAGSYSVTVSSAGCNSAFSATVGEAGALQLTGTSVQSPTCGNFDGKAGVTVTGGTSPYTYQWNSDAGNQTASPAIGLPAGTYAVTVTDNNGCMDSTTVSLSNSNAPNITEEISTISCHGNHDGAINITVTGGTSPYLYTWNVGPPQTNHQDLDSLYAGNYLVFVHDAQGCISVRSYTIADPTQLAVSVMSMGATCNTNDGSAMAMVTGGTSPYTYSWTGGGQTAESATGLGVGSYTVSITDHKGCMISGSTAVATSTPTPSICMVTVDDGSINNMIYWDKTMYTNVDSFIVYREVSSNQYVRIGAQVYDSLSVFTDTTRSVGPANGDPNAGTYRYKLQLVDACGNYSLMSLWHNTVYMVDAGGGQFTWNSYGVEGGNSGALVNNYNLICDTANLNQWFNVSTVAGTQQTAADPDFTSHDMAPNAVWRVKTDWSVSCDPTRAAILTSRSNKKHSNFVVNGISSLLSDDLGMKIYPNPAKDNLTIEFAPLEKNAKLKLINMLGQTVYNEVIIASAVKTVKQVDTGNLSKGVYYVVLETATKTMTKKLVIN
jgi:PKD repeat protein